MSNLKNRPYINLFKNPRINHINDTYNYTDEIIDLNYILNSKYFKNKYTNNKVLYSCKKKIIVKLKDKYDNYFMVKIHLDFDEYENGYNIYKILNSIKCDNIIRYIDFITEKKYWCEIYEYYNGYNLKEFMNTNKENISTGDIIDIFMQVTQGIKTLHDNNIIHCDIKLQNIMINSDKKIKIIDFDLSKITDDSFVCDYIFGTFEYISPESYDLCIHSKKSDVWELGILLYYLITKDFPYDNDDIQVSNSHEHLYRRNIFKYPNMEKIYDIIEQQQFPKSMCLLISKLLEFKDFNRFTTEEILNFKF